MLRDELQADFDRRGWVVVRGVVDREAVAAMHEVFTALVPEVAYPPGPDGVLREITGLSTVYEPLATIARDARFGALVAHALGAPRVQLLQDSLLYKPAHDGAPVEWHQDHTYIGFLVPARVATLRIALLPETANNGCMRIVDGSHRWGPIGATQSLTATSVASLVPSLAPGQREQLDRAAPLELEPGDISIHHVLALHGSTANRSASARRTIILRMFDAACRLDRSRLPPGAEAHFPTDVEGHLDPQAFPLVHAEP